jgi:alpha-methylacyl-CoA racemase
VAVGALEPQFYAALLTLLGLDPGTLPAQLDRSGWPGLRARFEEVFATRTRDDWAAAAAGTDACVTPVLAFGEVAEHPHLAARATIVAPGGVAQAAPAPRFSRTATELPAPQRSAEPADDVLADWPAR